MIFDLELEDFDADTNQFFKRLFNKDRERNNKREMRVTDQNHLNQKRLPNGRFAPKNATAHPGTFGTYGSPEVQSVAATPVTKLVAGITAAPAPLVNHIAIVLDCSGSMSGLKDAVKKNVNDTIRAIQKNARETGQETTISLIKFGVRGVRGGSEVEEEFVFKGANEVAELQNYNPLGWTPLFDGVGHAIERLRARADAGNKNVSFLVMTITDGIENSSTKYRSKEGSQFGRFDHRKSINSLMDEVHATDRWTLTFLLPPNSAEKFSSTHGVPAGNCREWEGTVRGLELASHTTQAGVTHYYQNRSLGQTSTAGFYTDLSTLTPTQLANNLQDIQDKVKLYTVEKETEIRPFVEEKTGKPYSLGTAFYQLTKPEKVQAGKQILVKEKTKNAVYGGYDARKVLGIPQGTDLRIKPGNHANYDIYVQSTSTNRKLVRGTKLIVLK